MRLRLANNSMKKVIYFSLVTGKNKFFNMDLLKQFFFFLFNISFLSLQDKLAKEEKSCKLNLNKINQQWRQIMRDAKSVELQKVCSLFKGNFGGCRILKNCIH